MPLLLLSLPFWAVAVLTRWFCRFFEPQAAPWTEIVEFDSVLGWKPKANLDTYCSFPAGVFHVRTDARGWRGKAKFEDSNIVVIGDSFAFGFGVDDRYAFFSQTDSRLRIKAIGAPGYNMVQEVLWMDQLRPHLKGKLVVWLICVSNDLYDNVLPNLQQYRTPFVRETNGSGTWEIVTSHLNITRWPFSFEHNFRAEEKYTGVFGENFLSQRMYSACDFLLSRGRDLCHRAGAQLVVMTVPWPIQFNPREWQRIAQRFGDAQTLNPSLPDQKIGGMCSRLGLRLISGTEIFNHRDHIPREGHWNERGHRRLAELLLEIHQDHVHGNKASLVTGLALQGS
jgi:hypothetical protein